MSAILLGITGNIGSGKSSVSRIMESLGAAVVDSDIEAHALANEDSEYRHELSERFGDGLFANDGTFLRGELAKRLFGDPIAVSDFNAIIAPRLVMRTRSKMKKFAETFPVVILDGALIFEYGRQGDFNEVWLVVTDVEISNQRLLARGLSMEQIERRRAAQWTEEVKRPLASRVIENNKTLEDLERSVKILWNELISNRV